MAIIDRKVLITVPLDEVYTVARDPHRWHTWWAGLTNPDRVQGHGEVGTVVKQSFLIAGFTFPFTFRVTEDTRGMDECRWRGEIEGPLKGHHEWIYRKVPQGTEATAHIEYTVPGKLLEKTLDKLVIEKLMENGMTHTMENLKLVCEKVPAIAHA